jgi:hypothetical protein
MAFSGNPLAYAGGPWVVGDRATTAVTKRALEDAGMVTRDPESEGPDYRASRTLTAAGREEGDLALACKGKAPLGWVRFGDVARRRCGEQAQYASRYIDGRNGQPNLGNGLRFRGRVEDYHRILIHADDVEEWVRRWKANEEATASGSLAMLEAGIKSAKTEPTVFLGSFAHYAKEQGR